MQFFDLTLLMLFRQRIGSTFLVSIFPYLQLSQRFSFFILLPLLHKGSQYYVVHSKSKSRSHCMRNSGTLQALFLFLVQCQARNLYLPFLIPLFKFHFDFQSVLLLQINVMITFNALDLIDKVINSQTEEEERRRIGARFFNIILGYINVLVTYVHIIPLCHSKYQSYKNHYQHAFLDCTLQVNRKSAYLQ